MICKIDGLRRSGNNDYFIVKLLETFEEKSMQLQRLKETVEEMKQLEGEYAKTIDELMLQHHKTIKEKDKKLTIQERMYKLCWLGRRGVVIW